MPHTTQCVEGADATFSDSSDSIVFIYPNFEPVNVVVPQYCTATILEGGIISITGFRTGGYDYGGSIDGVPFSFNI